MATERNDEQRAFDRFAEAVLAQEVEVIQLMLTKKLGQMTDKENERALSLCETDVYRHRWGSETRVFHAGEFLVGFSSRWIHDEMQVAVKTKDGTGDSLFAVNRRDYQ